MSKDLAIETNALSKFYGRLHAVDSVDLRVGRGEIYGFLGLNGAGKTTTIRALLGMVHPSAGSVKVLGQVVGPNGHGPWRQVGHLVESPSAYPELTVRENLEIARRLQGISDRRVTERIIERLGLAAYANSKAGILSTGNLQRLGLARALQHEPELLILDEPANGLDPAGLVEVRQLLESLVKEKGVTVFMSSHILTEVDRLATRIGIIHHGRLLEELEADQFETLRSRYLEIKTRHQDQAQNVLVQAGYTVKASDDTLYLFEPGCLDAPDKVAALLVNAGLPPTRLAVEQENLEDYFLRLTGEKE
jgi:ABC-2 type transport system ATP-binding protein